MSGAYRVLLIFFTGALYIFAHEFGHYAVAAEYGLNPTFVYGGYSDTGLLGMALGVSHRATTPVQSFFIVFGATMFPLAFAVFLTGASILKGHEDLALMAETFILLIAINLIPIPGMGNMDANRVWHFLLGTNI
ncbi:MAG: hypothetical protein QXD77_01605 [Candidatus Aenigmatarchaeota archaeon]